MDNIVLALGMMGAFLLGSWVTYKAYQHKSPVDIPQAVKDVFDDIPEPISPYAEAKKTERTKVNI